MTDKEKDKEKEAPKTCSTERVVWEFVKSIGQNLLNGADLQKTAFPVHINQPRSYLEMIIDGWVYAPIYLTRSAQTSDPVERFKLVITFVISGLHNTCYLGKPFNPILGETYQARFPDGTMVYCEQSSHHPPVTAWQVLGPGGAYRMYGWGEWMASFRGNSVKGWQKGALFVEYADGGRITWTLPHVMVHGVLWGDRIIEYEGQAQFRDAANQLTCELTVPPPSGGLFSGWFSKKLPSDYFVGELAQAGKRLARVEGTWLGAIEFDGRRYWSVTDKFVPAEPVPEAESGAGGGPLVLPSDARFREDVRLLKAGKAKEAAEAKVRLEELQRRDARLRREAAQKRGVPRAPSTDKVSK